MARVSIIIPSRDCKYVSNTVEDIYRNATGDVEVLVLLDDYWPDPPIKDHPTLTIIHKGKVGGLRHSVNLGAKIAKGKYIAKCDDHCSFAKGFDEILQKDMEDNWLVNPSRYSLNPVTWERGVHPTDYTYLTYPYNPKNKYGNGLYSKKWIGENGVVPKNWGRKEYYWKERHSEDKPIDDIMTFQGSFWMMTRDHFFRIGMLDEKHCDLMENEPQELALKTWLIGGRCIVNKKTYYCHVDKNENEKDARSRAFGLSFNAMRETGRFQTWYWTNDRWPLATRTFEWFVNHFSPIPGWPKNWMEEKLRFEQENPGFGKDFKIFDEQGVDSLKCVV
jgi:glycosyltransferase involved in cell wall biosynthesis